MQQEFVCHQTICACMTAEGSCGCEPDVDGRCIRCKCLTYEKVVASTADTCDTEGDEVDG